jgi:hypothetical protein
MPEKTTFAMLKAYYTAHLGTLADHRGKQHWPAKYPRVAGR